MTFDRWAIVEAEYLYATLWGPKPDIEARLRRIRFRPGIMFSLENCGEETKRRYGEYVRRREYDFVACERLIRRGHVHGPWPGTNNMPGQDAHDKCRRWFAGQLNTSLDRASAVIYAVA